VNLKENRHTFASTEVMIASKLSLKVLVACCHRELRRIAGKVGRIGISDAGKTVRGVPVAVERTMNVCHSKILPQTRSLILRLAARGTTRGDVARHNSDLVGDQQHELERSGPATTGSRSSHGIVSVHRRKVNHPRTRATRVT